MEARIAGYREALFVWSGSIEPTLVQRLETGDESEVGRMIETLKPEAIIGANDRTAGQFMQSLIRLNYQVPKDVRIAGIDDVGYASLLPVPLTTVHQPCREIGAAAVDAMLQRVARPDMPVRDILLDCKLVVRIPAELNCLPRAPEDSPSFVDGTSHAAASVLCLASLETFKDL